MNILMNQTKLYKLSPKFWQVTIILFISLAFILSDWIALYSSFGDFIMIFSVVLLVCLGQIKIIQKQFILIAIPIGILIFTSLLSYFFNDYWFNTFRALLSSSKFVFYILALVLYYNFIKDNHLENNLLKISNVFAVLTIVIGIILIVLIYSDMSEVYHSIWRYTRKDNMSYYFIGNTDIVRARSLFSEPAHLGYYLNTVFYANIFSKKKPNYLMLSIISIGIILTLSYSMIIIFFLTGFSYLLVEAVRGKLSWSHWYWLIIASIGAVLIYFWDFIYITIIQRTLNILSGQDGSAYNRIVESWMYVEDERMLYGNGIGHTPPVTNIFAYIMSDFGLIGLIPYLVFTFKMLVRSLPVFVLFVLMNIAKGGYLNPAYWLFLLFVFIYGLSEET